MTVEEYFHAFWTSVFNGGEWSASRHPALTRKKEPTKVLNRRLSGPQKRCGYSADEETFLSRTGSRTNNPRKSYKWSQLGAQFILSIFINLYMFRATMCPSSRETVVFLRHLVLVILCGWLSGMQGGMELMTSHQFHSAQVSHKHSCFSWWWAHIRPKRVEINKYTKNKLCTKLALCIRLYRDVGKQNLKNSTILVCPASSLVAMSHRHTPTPSRVWIKLIL